MEKKSKRPKMARKGENWRSDFAKSVNFVLRKVTFSEMA